MKVALFADTFLPQINGVTNTLIKLMEYYEKTGIEYKLFVPRYETDKPDYNVERFYSIKFFIYPEARVTFPNFKRINTILADFKPDIVHNMTEFNMGTTGMGYGKAHNVPTI
ncbi:MAG: glycosyltransferase, partial [Eubacteriales bacterium]